MKIVIIISGALTFNASRLNKIVSMVKELKGIDSTNISLSYHSKPYLNKHAKGSKRKKKEPRKTGPQRYCSLVSLDLSYCMFIFMSKLTRL